MNYETLVKSLKVKKILLIGDFLLDTYTEGDVTRISPEAPVPVLRVKNIHSCLGGAGNVLLNLLALGAEVFPLGRIGSDKAGKSIIELISDLDVTTEAIIEEDDYATSNKNRMVCDYHQLLRIDTESTCFPSKKVKETLLKYYRSYLNQVDIVVISDYNKGLLEPAFLQEMITFARVHNVPILCDPKGLCYEKYHGVTLIKPNEKEAYAALKIPSEAPIHCLKDLLKVTEAKALFVTRGSQGVTYFTEEDKPMTVPTDQKTVKDVTGAGDTVLATLALSWANGLPLYEAAKLCNLSAGIAVEKFGCTAVSYSALLQRAQEKDQHAATALV